MNQKRHVRPLVIDDHSIQNFVILYHLRRSTYAYHFISLGNHEHEAHARILNNVVKRIAAVVT